MMDVIRYLIRESAIPEDPANPWQAAAYATGKAFAGVLLAAATHLAIVSATGVVAGKLWVALGPVVVAYAWEARQGWQGRDTLADLIFWKIGILGTVLSFTETGPGQVSPVPGAFFASLVVLAGALLIYITPKVRADAG